MSRIRIERRPDALKLTLGEVKDTVADAFVLVSGLVLLFFCVLPLTADGIVIPSWPLAWGAVATIVAVAFRGARNGTAAGGVQADTPG